MNRSLLQSQPGVPIPLVKDSRQKEYCFLVQQAGVPYAAGQRFWKGEFWELFFLVGRKYKNGDKR